MSIDRPAIEKSVSGFIASEAMRLERRNDSCNKIRELMKRWDNRLTFEGLSLSKQYLEGRLKFLANLDIFHGGNYAHCYVHVQRSKEFKFDKWFMGKFDRGTVLNVDAMENRYQQLVFIHNVEVMNGTKRSVPSLVRLERANYLDDIWAGSVYVSLLNRSLKIIPFQTEREVNFIRALMSEPHQITSKNIQRSSKVTNLHLR